MTFFKNCRLSMCPLHRMLSTSQIMCYKNTVSHFLSFGGGHVGQSLDWNVNFLVLSHVMTRTAIWADMRADATWKKICEGVALEKKHSSLGM